MNESVVEEAALAWLEALGYEIKHGPEIAAGEPGAERSDSTYRDVVLEGRLRRALARLTCREPPGRKGDAVLAGGAVRLSRLRLLRARHRQSPRRAPLQSASCSGR